MTLLLLVMTGALFAQSLPYDPADPEGIQIWPNKLGRYPWKRRGIFQVAKLDVPTGNPGRAPAVTAAEMQQMKAVLDGLSAVVKATPTASTGLVGYWMKESRTFFYPDAASMPAGVVLRTAPFSFASGFYPFRLEDVLRNGQFVPQWGGETTPSYIEFNRLPGVLKQPVVLREAGPRDTAEVEMYTRPQVTGQWAGYPVYDGAELVMARAGRDPWVAVAYGRAMKAAMPLLEKDVATAEQRLAGLKKQNEEAQSAAYEEKMRAHLEKYSGAFRTSDPKKWEGRLAGMERELKYNREQTVLQANPKRDKDGDWYWNPVDAHADAVRRMGAMKAEEAARPACFAAVVERKNGRYALVGDVLPAGSGAGCKELVTTNFEYFDAKLPRSAPQMLTVRDMDLCVALVNGKWVNRDRPRADRPPQGCLKLVPIWEEMDWKAVGALVLR